MHSTLTRVKWNSRSQVSTTDWVYIERVSHTHIRASESTFSHIIPGCFKNGKPFSSTNTPEVIKRDVPDSDASQTLVLDVRTLVASRVRVLIGHPQANFRARIWQTESIGAKFVRRVCDTAQDMRS